MTLSGRVDDIESKLSYLVQDLLQRPTINTFSDYRLVWNQQFDLVQDNIELLKEDIYTLQALYANIVLGVSGVASSSSGLQETFETINKNLKQYNYSMSYDTGSYLTGIRYNITNTSYVDKKLSYNLSGLLTGIELSGSPLPSTSLHKYFFYSGDTLTGVSYN